MDMTTNLKHLQEYELLESQTTTTDGVWADVTSFKRLTLDVSGITIGTFQVRGSCAASIPANSSDAHKIGNDYTADALIELTLKLKYVKIKVTVATDVSINARAVGESTKSGY